MFLDIESPISAGREIWGFPKKFAKPSIKTCQDTLVGRLNYAGCEVAFGKKKKERKKILLKKKK